MINSSDTFQKAKKGLAYAFSQGHPLSTYGECIAQCAAGAMIMMQIFRYEHLWLCLTDMV